MVILPDTLAFLEGLGGPEVMLIFVVVLVLFGGNKLPEFARGLGKTMREFKKAAAGVEDEFKRALEDDERKKTIAAPPVTPALTAPMVVAASAATPHPNPDGLPPEALAPDPTMPEAPAPSVDSIPPPPLIPLGNTAAAEIPPTEATEPLSTDVPKPATGNMPTPTLPIPPLATGNRNRDDYS